MSVKIFKPGSNNNKYPIKIIAPSNQGSFGTTIPAAGTWTTVPVHSITWVSYPNALVPTIDLDLLEIEDTRDGLDCSMCKEFYPYAIANQPDNKTLICYSCRNGY